MARVLLAKVVLGVLFTLSFSWQSNASKSQTVLIGGGLNICSSAEPKNCVNKIKSYESTHVENQYSLSKHNLSKFYAFVIKHSRLYSTEMSSFVTALKKVKTSEKAMDERSLKRYLRKYGISLSSALNDYQKQAFLDILQVPIVTERFMQRDSKKRIKVDLHNSLQPFVAKALRLFTDQVDGDEIVFVTAANSDAYEEVYLLEQVFEQLDVDVTWLPIDTAVAKIWSEHASRKLNGQSESDDEALEQACLKLEDVRQQHSGRYFRGSIYPSLAERLNEVCRTPAILEEMVDDADGIYFHDGSPLFLTQSLMNNNKPHKWFAKALEKHKRGKLVFSFNGNTVSAITGVSENKGNAVILNGDSHNALLNGFTPYINNLDQLSKNNHALSKGLGLFEGFIFDSHLGEQSNHGRIATAMAENNTEHGIGIDERTVLLIKQQKDKLVFEVTGEAGVTIFERKSSSIKKNSPYSTRYKLTYLTHNDHAFIKNNKFTIDFADWKYSSNKTTQPVINSGNVFRPKNFSNTLFMLCTTGAIEATLKHVELGKGHILNIKKPSMSVSVSGNMNVQGDSFGFCSFRDYEMTIFPVNAT